MLESGIGGVAGNSTTISGAGAAVDGQGIAPAAFHFIAGEFERCPYAIALDFLAEPRQPSVPLHRPLLLVVRDMTAAQFDRDVGALLRESGISFEAALRALAIIATPVHLFSWHCDQLLERRFARLGIALITRPLGRITTAALVTNGRYHRWGEASRNLLPARPVAEYGSP